MSKYEIELAAASKHHLIHGDMDGSTCLLSKCALHYPKKEATEKGREAGEEEVRRQSRPDDVT